MHIKSIVAGTAIALAVSLGSASAADQFSALEGLAAEPLTPHEMGAIFGAANLVVDPAAVSGTLGFPFDVIHQPDLNQPAGRLTNMAAALSDGPGVPGGSSGVVVFTP